MEKYELYRDSLDGLPSCQLEVQLYQKKIQDLADNRDKLAGILKEVRGGCCVWCVTVYPVPCECFPFLAVFLKKSRIALQYNRCEMYAEK